MIVSFEYTLFGPTRHKATVEVDDDLWTNSADDMDDRLDVLGEIILDSISDRLAIIEDSITTDEE